MTTTTVSRWTAIACAAAVLSLAVAAQAAETVSALKQHDTAGPIDIVADRLEVRQKESLAVFKGSVEANQGDLTLKADAVTVYYSRDQGADGPAIARLDATGGVEIQSPSERVEGTWGVYDVERRVVTLGGSVVLQRGDTLIRGDRLELDLDTGITKLDGAPTTTGADQNGRVRGRFSVPGEQQPADETPSADPQGDPGGGV